MSQAQNDGPSSPERFTLWAAAVAKDGDQLAFIALFDHFAPRINAYLLRLGLERSAAEELTQEVMLTLWRKAHLFDPAKSSLATWLFRIARNKRIDALRRQRAENLDENDPLLLPGEAMAPDIELAAQNLTLTISSVLSELPPEQSSLIRLAYFDGLSHSEIAEISSLPLGTVKSRIRVAFSRLRGALALRGIDAID